MARRDVSGLCRPRDSQAHWEKHEFKSQSGSGSFVFDLMIHCGIQAASLVLDDFLDNGKTRRGQKCWYLVDKVRAVGSPADRFVYLILGLFKAG